MTAAWAEASGEKARDVRSVFIDHECIGNSRHKFTLKTHLNHPGHARHQELPFYSSAAEMDTSAQFCQICAVSSPKVCIAPHRTAPHPSAVANQGKRSTRTEPRH